MSDPGQVAATDQPEFLAIRAGGQVFALSLKDIVEVIRTPPWAELPRVPAFLRGVAQHRAEAIPIFELAGRLGLTAEGQTPRERVVVVKSDNGRAGLLVEEIVGVWRDAEQLGQRVRRKGGETPLLGIAEIVDWRKVESPR